MLQAEIWTVVQVGDGNTVLLRTMQKNIAVPISIGRLEAHSMIVGMEETSLPRPLTHDLMLNLLDSQNLVLDRVEIHGLKENVFYARLVICGERRDALSLDCRPSDALCLAARRKCPVLVSGEVISLAGLPVDSLVDDPSDGDFPDGGDPPPGDGHRRRLLDQLADAVEREEYEQAAKIRDVIKAMEGE